jgi:uncharacterized damage-inducible protein DinB
MPHLKKGTERLQKALVEEAFYHLKTTPKNLQKIGMSIAEYLSSKGESVGSVKTIIRHMRASDKIWTELIKMGVVKDKPTLVQ